MGDGKKDAYEVRLFGDGATVIKDSNPKDDAGSARIDLALLSPFALAEEALAMEEGATKYGRYNYTVVGVKSRVYVSALLRHVFKWLLGEERDPKTGVHHLGSARACLGILLDAQVRGKLFDDRPPSRKEASNWLDAMEARVKHVREAFKAHSPRHYSIEDTYGTGEQTHPGSSQATAGEGALREDAQRVPRRDGGRVVQPEGPERPVDRVQVVAQNAQNGSCNAGLEWIAARLADRTPRGG